MFNVCMYVKTYSVHFILNRNLTEYVSFVFKYQFRYYDILYFVFLYFYYKILIKIRSSFTKSVT